MLSDFSNTLAFTVFILFLNVVNAMNLGIVRSRYGMVMFALVILNMY